MDSDITDLLSVSEAAQRLHLSAQRVRVLADLGRLPCVWTSLGRLFEPEVVEQFAATRGPFGRYEARARYANPSDEKGASA